MDTLLRYLSDTGVVTAESDLGTYAPQRKAYWKEDPFEEMPGEDLLGKPVDTHAEAPRSCWSAITAVCADHRHVRMDSGDNKVVRKG